MPNTLKKAFCFKAVVALAGVAVLATAFGATECTWTGGGDGTTWSDSANWGGTAPEGADYSAVFYDLPTSAGTTIAIDGLKTISQFLPKPKSGVALAAVFRAQDANSGIIATASDSFIFGRSDSQAGSSVDFTFDGGVYTGNYIRVSRKYGDATVRLKGGAKFYTQQARIGNASEATTAQMFVTDGAEWISNLSDTRFFMCSDCPGTSLVKVDGGTLTATGAYISIGGNSAGNYDSTLWLESGAIDTKSFVVGGVYDSNKIQSRSGANGKGLLVVNGGTLTAKENCYIGANTAADAIAEMIVSNGVVRIDNDCLYVGENGNGTLTMEGGELVMKDTAYGVTLTHGNGGNAILNLNGGTLTTPRFRMDKLTSGSGTINFNGTTIKATRATAQFLDANDLLVCNIQSGNLIIDTDYNITISANLTGAGGIVKRGTGTLLLTGDNTFDGGIVVEGGLAIASSESSAIDGTAGGAYATTVQLHDGLLEAWLEDPAITNFTSKYGAAGTVSYERPRIVSVKYGDGEKDVLSYTNLETGATVEWTAGENSGSFTTKSLAPRTLAVDGPTKAIANVRDIGSWPLASVDGTLTMKQGVIFRGGNLDDFGSASAEQRSASELTRLGLKTEIDLRMQSKNEISSTYLTLATDGTDNSFAADDCAYYRFELGWGESAGTQIGADDSGNFTNQIRNVFSTLGTEGRLPAYFHCAIGTDRTGITGLLLLAMMGVEEEVLYRDYLMSNFANIGGSRSPAIVDNFLRYLLRGNCNGGKYVYSDNAYGNSVAARARAYLEMCGVTQEELGNITQALSGETLEEILARVNAYETANDFRTVNFVSYPGSSTTSAIHRVSSAAKAVLPYTAPTRSGYVFRGWDVENESEVDLDGNSVVYGIWEKVSYVWVGGESGSWSNTARWEPSTGYPVAGDTVIFTNDVTVTLSVDAQVSNLRIADGCMVKFVRGSKALLYADSIEGEGTLAFDNCGLTAYNGATLSSESSLTLDLRNGGWIEGRGGTATWSGSVVATNGNVTIYGTTSFNGNIHVDERVTMTFSGYGNNNCNGTYAFGPGCAVTGSGAIRFAGTDKNYVKAKLDSSADFSAFEGTFTKVGDGGMTFRGDKSTSAKASWTLYGDVGYADMTDGSKMEFGNLVTGKAGNGLVMFLPAGQAHTIEIGALDGASSLGTSANGYMFWSGDTSNRGNMTLTVRKVGTGTLESYLYNPNKSSEYSWHSRIEIAGGIWNEHGTLGLRKVDSFGFEYTDGAFGTVSFDQGDIDLTAKTLDIDIGDGLTETANGYTLFAAAGTLSAPDPEEDIEGWVFAVRSTDAGMEAALVPETAPATVKWNADSGKWVFYTAAGEAILLEEGDDEPWGESISLVVDGDFGRDVSALVFGGVVVEGKNARLTADCVWTNHVVTLDAGAWLDLNGRDLALGTYYAGEGAVVTNSDESAMSVFAPGKNGGVMSGNANVKFGGNLQVALVDVTDATGFTSQIACTHTGGWLFATNNTAIKIDDQSLGSGPIRFYGQGGFTNSRKSDIIERQVYVQGGGNVHATLSSVGWPTTFNGAVWHGDSDAGITFALQGTSDTAGGGNPEFGDDADYSGYHGTFKITNANSGSWGILLHTASTARDMSNARVVLGANGTFNKRNGSAKFGIGDLSTDGTEYDENKIVRGFYTWSSNNQPANWEIGGLGLDSVFAGRIVKGDEANKNANITKVGGGIWTLNAELNQTGTFTIGEGRVDMNRSSASSVAFTVNASGELGGTGTIAGAVTVNGSIAPGTAARATTNEAIETTAAGTLTVASATFNPGATLKWKHDGVSSSRLVLTGTGETDVSNLAIEIDAGSLEYLASSIDSEGTAFTLLSSNGSLSGSVSKVWYAGKWRLEAKVNDDRNAIVLVANSKYFVIMVR